MDNNLKLFTDTLRMIGEKDLASALSLIKPYIKERPYVSYTEEVENVDENFRLMLHYVKQGVDDPMRESMYGDMLTKLKKAVRNIRNDYRRRNIDFYKDANSHVAENMPLSEKAIQIKLENFVADIAMLQFEDEDTKADKGKQLYTEHYRFIQSLFCSIVVSDLWTKEQAQSMLRLLLSPTIDVTDVQIIVSSLMLATMNNFDINKFKVLVKLYLNTADSRVKQKALIGWVFSMTDSIDTEEQRLCISEMCEDDNVIRDLFDLQKQVLFCMNAERDNATIQRDIMPTLIKNSNFNVSRFGVTEKEDDPMTDILDPEAQDRAMEETEEKFQEMMKMHDSGADIYFGGFSQMKRFPFFYSLANWFCPFDIKHPDLARRTEKLRDNNFLQNLLAHGPFCDNDKYSFALALATVIDKLPDGVKEMIGNGDVLGHYKKQEDLDTEAYLRRLSLQDLYRFFRLYRYHDQVYNPFTQNTCLFITNILFKGTPVEQKLADFAKFIVKRKSASQLKHIVVALENQNSVQANMVKGVFYLEYSFEYEKAKQCFKEILKVDENNEKALIGYAKAVFRNEDIDEAYVTYAKLYNENPDRRSVAIDFSVTLIKCQKYEEAAKVLFRLNFKYPDSLNINRLLAWTMMGQKKINEAEKLYLRLIGSSEAVAMDFLNGAYCKLFAKDITGSIERFVRFCKIRIEESKKNISEIKYMDVATMLDEEFQKDAEMLDSYAISTIDKIFMKKLTYDSLIG